MAAHLRPRSLLLCLVSLAAVGLLGQACGKKKSSSSPGPSVGPIESAFQKAAASNNLPVRFVLAAAWVESRLAPSRSSTPYVNPSDQSDQVYKGLRLSQTAFGLTQEQLGVSGQENAETLSVQVAAYAALLKDRVSSLKLSRSPATAEEKFQWIWEMAQLHRDGLTGRRNVQIIFANELISAMNQGFVWQDSDTGEVITMQKEIPALKIQDFPVDRQALFQLDTMSGQVRRAEFLHLVNSSGGGQVRNEPQRIEIVHCPLTLSACLELQTKGQGDEVRLGSHYLIPEDPIEGGYVDRALQVALHDEVVSLTGTDGNFRTVQDAIVVTLVGNSGRYIQGKRVPAIPTWMTSNQLRLLGGLVNDICARLATDNSVDFNACISIGGANGVRFRNPAGEDYRWGDIPDFDETIFRAHIASGGALQDATAFEFGSESRRFAAGQLIPLVLRFGPRAKLIELESLVRCADQRVVWAPEQAIEVRSITKRTIEVEKNYAGPNDNGDHFFRARVLGANGEVIGWAVDRIYLSNFAKVGNVAPSKYCLRNGS